MINHFKYLLLILFSSISFATTIHVATTGSDDNDGSEGSPFATIQAGINAASDGDTVLVGAGTYEENLDVSIGDDYYFAGIVLCSEFVYYSDSTSIIENTIIAANSISSRYGDNTFYGFTIKDNDTPTNLNFYYSNSTFKNCFFNNVYDGGVSGTDSTVFQNCTLFNSFNDWGGRWAIVHNSILISSFTENSYGHNMSFTYNDLGYNENGNISDVNPLFCDSENGDYTLAANSPLVGAGENGTDIGALGVGCEAFDLSLTINEIMNNPSAVSDSDGEWFEIYNNGDVSHDLNGWTIKDNNASHIINNSILIHPGDYKIFSNNSNQNSNGGVVVDYEYGSITLANSGDEIVLIDPNGTVFDSVAYDGGPEFPDLNGASMGVIDSETDNNIGSNWQASTTAYGDGDLGTPGLPNFSSDIDVELTTIDFDTVLVGESLDKVLTISNTGNTTLLIDSVYTSSGSFTLPFTETSVETSLELNITFTPSAYGIVEDILVIKTNDPDEGHVEIPLIGLGYIPSPNIVLETTSIDFGTVMDGLTEKVELHVANDGDATLSLSSVYIEGSTTFTIPNFSASVAEEDTGSIDVQFSPDDETSFSGTLCIVSNDPDTDTLMLALSGVGGEQAPIMVLSDDELYFGTVQAGTTVEREVIIYNEGMLDLEIEEITINGSDYYTTTFSDGSVEPGDSVVVPFSFAPTEQVAEVMATATVASNDGTQTIELKAGYNGPVWHVATIGSDETGDGTESYPFFTIQKGVDMSQSGDTVLVHPGTYNEYNLGGNTNNDKESVFLISTLGPDSTVIDGNMNGAIIRELSKNMHVEGFTITGGSTYDDYYVSWQLGAIGVYNSEFFRVESITIKNVIFRGNQLDLNFAYGNGSGNNSYLNNPLSVIVSNCTFICESNDIPNIRMEGEGNYTIINSIFYTEDDNNIFLIPWSNDEGYYNMNLNNSIISPGINVPDWFFNSGGNIVTDPLFCDLDNGDFSLAANSPAIGAGENETDIGALGVGCEEATETQSLWHVATTGSDETGDGTEENPFATIQFGIDNITENDSLFVHAGTYVENISISKSIIMVGEDKETTIIDGNQEGSVLFVGNVIDTVTTIQGFTLKNGKGDLNSETGGGITISNSTIKISDMIIKENTCPNSFAGGIWMYESNPIISNAVIMNNSSFFGGGGIFINDSDPIISNVVVTGNVTNEEGGGVNILGTSSPSFYNVEISHNIAYQGAGLWCYGDLFNDAEGKIIAKNLFVSHNESTANTGGIRINASEYELEFLTVINNTANNETAGVYLYDAIGSISNSTISQNNSQVGELMVVSGSAEIKNCIIYGSNYTNEFLPIWKSSEYEPNLQVSFSNIYGGWEGIGNIDADPLFCDAENEDFRVEENSPVVGTGENGSNMGALGVGCEEILSIDQTPLPEIFVLHQNYPNPFNPITSLKFDLPKQAVVTLSIYDLMGRKIRTLINSELNAGFKNIQWNARDNLGKSVPAGMYIYTIQAGEFRQTRKMVLLK